MTATGRKRGSLSQRARTAPAIPATATAQEEIGRRRGLSDESRSVRSPWVWRGFAFMTLVSLGLAVTFAVDGHRAYAVAWAVITVAWGATAGILWKAHLRVT